LILHEICEAINNLNTKVDIIAEAVSPMQENMKVALANCAFDKDLISHLLSASTKDLANMESQSYAKYIEGMTLLGKKRGITEAEEFHRALEQLHKIIPDSFLTDIRARHEEVIGWQKAVEQKFKDSRIDMTKLHAHLEEFKKMAESYEQKMKGAAKLASLQMEKGRMEIRGEVASEMSTVRNSAKVATDDMSREALGVISKLKAEMSSHLDTAQSELRKTVAEMESKTEMLEDLAKSAGQNIIETGRMIAQNSNSQPRSKRGRRNK
jgi:hypothetical protein